MAQVNSADVFPSLRTISTDSVGELQEITSVPALRAGGVLSTDIVLNAVNLGADANNIVVSIVENFGGASNSIAINGSAIEVRLKEALTPASGGTPSTLDYNGAFTLTTLNNGGTNIDFHVVDNIATTSGSDEVKINASDDDVSVCLVGDITTYSNQDIRNLLTDTTTAWYAGLQSIFIVGDMISGEDTAQAIEFSSTFSNGTVDVNQSATLQDIVDLISGSSEASALVTASVASEKASDLPSVDSEQLDGGSDATIADLEANSQYVLLKIDEIHGLTADETNDARKVTWGVIEQYAQYILGQSVENQPENFILTRGNPTLVIDGAGTRIRQVYSIQSFYATGDFDLEDETSV
jgi:hypothetical protein